MLVSGSRFRPVKRVLIAYFSKPPIGEYLTSAFRRRGIESSLVFSDENHPFDRYFIRHVTKFLHNTRVLPKGRSAFEEHPLTHRNFRANNLLNTYRTFSPDLVLVIRGIGFRRDVLAQIKTETPLFGWWIEREEQMGEAFREIDTFDWYFFMHSSCVEHGKANGYERVSLLHHAVDPDAFYPMKDTAKDVDICFVGGWSSKRQALIEALAKTVTSNIVIYGPKWRKKNALRPSILSLIKGSYVGGTNLVKLYNRSKIVLNVTNWGFGEGHKRSGLTMRILEVPATGAFLLTDDSRDLRNVVTPDRHLAVYSDLENCVQKARYFLNHSQEREAIAADGCKHVRTNYTYDHVVDKILEIHGKLAQQTA